METIIADDKAPKIPDSWTGIVPDIALRELAPAKGYIADE
jgi:hypothetical protein